MADASDILPTLSDSELLIWVASYGAAMLSPTQRRRVDALRVMAEQMKRIAVPKPAAARARTGPTDQIIETVAAHYGAEPQELKTAVKLKRVWEMRMVCMYLMRRRLGMTYAAVGEAMGGRDHSSISHGVKKAKSVIRRDPEMQKQVAEIEAELNSRLAVSRAGTEAA